MDNRLGGEDADGPRAAVGFSMKIVQKLAVGSALNEKTQAQACLSVLAATRLTSGIPFHVVQAKKAGAARQQVVRAIQVRLPAAMEAFDAPYGD